MDIEVQETDFCKLKVRVELDNDIVSSTKNEVINEFRKFRPVKGFRQGKATPEAIKFQYKKELPGVINRELTRKAYDSAILEKNIKPFGHPQMQIASMEGTKFVCEFSVNKMPDFELAQYKGFEIPKPADPISSEEFGAKILQDLRTRFGTIEPYSEGDFVQIGDNVIANYTATDDNGLPIESLSVDGEVIQVGKTPIDGFDSNLLGMNIGEEREFVIKIPENSGASDLAGKQAHFKLKLIMGSKTIPAPIDEALASKFNLKTVDELMSEVNSTATSRLNDIRQNALINQLTNRLVDIHQFRVPTLLGTTEAQVKVRSQNKDWNAIRDEEKEKLIQDAEKSIRLSLVLEKVREIEPEAQLTDDEAMKLAQENIIKNSQKPQELFDNIVKAGQLQLLLNNVRDEATLSFILKNSTIVE